MNLGFLDATARLDDDGYHVIQSHICKDIISESMLPWPTWQVEGKKVFPSLLCDRCGLHVTLELT